MVFERSLSFQLLKQSRENQQQSVKKQLPFFGINDLSLKTKYVNPVAVAVYWILSPWFCLISTLRTKKVQPSEYRDICEGFSQEMSTKLERQVQMRVWRNHSISVQMKSRASRCTGLMKPPCALHSVNVESCLMLLEQISHELLTEEL